MSKWKNLTDLTGDIIEAIDGAFDAGRLPAAHAETFKRNVDAYATHTALALSAGAAGKVDEATKHHRLASAAKSVLVGLDGVSKYRMERALVSSAKSILLKVLVAAL